MKTLMHCPPNLKDLPKFSLSLSQPRQLLAASSFKLKVGGVATAIRVHFHIQKVWVSRQSQAQTQKNTNNHLTGSTVPEIFDETAVSQRSSPSQRRVDRKQLWAGWKRTWVEHETHI